MKRKFELNGKTYRTDAKTAALLREIMPSAKATGDSSAVIAVMALGLKTGDIVEVQPAPTTDPRKAPLAEVCMYGTGDIGFGWLAVDVEGNRYGTGKPNAQQGCTAALHTALSHLRGTGASLMRGVTVYAPGGEYCAEIMLGWVGNYGDLVWKPAKVYEIDAATLIAAAQ